MQISTRSFALEQLKMLFGLTVTQIHPHLPIKIKPGSKLYFFFLYGFNVTESVSDTSRRTVKERRSDSATVGCRVIMLP